LGAALLSAGTICLLLATVWGGITYAWGSAQIIGLLVGGAVLAGLFVLQEKRASEPIVPPRLFRSDIFRVSSLLSLLAGIAMFAAILYIPLYQQAVRGYSPTKSGLLMLPLVIGLLIASIVSGQLTTKLGRYKIFPIIGTAILSLGLWLFSHVTLTTSELTLGLWMLVIGIGLGTFMQIMTLAVQNSVSRSEIGTATSVVTFFRSLGSSFGGAIFGTILINRLAKHLSDLTHGNPLAQHVDVGSIQSGVSTSLPPEIAHDILQAFTLAFRDTFLLAIPFALLAFVAAFFLREAPLSNTHEAEPLALE
jgi:MFS family permease